MRSESDYWRAQRARASRCPGSSCWTTGYTLLTTAVNMGVSDPSKQQQPPNKNAKSPPARHRSVKMAPSGYSSTNLFQFSLPQTLTSYAEDYGPKPPTKTDISDFSTENMRNNPHPKEVNPLINKKLLTSINHFAGFLVMATTISFTTLN